MSSTDSLDARLAERLRRANLVSDEQLDSARTIQEESPLPLADALIRLEILSQSEVERIVDSLQEVRFVKLEDMQIDREAVRHVPGRVARAHRCIPVRRTGNMLVVAASDPTAPELLDALEAVTDCELLILAAEAEAVEHALYIHYSGDEGAGRLSGHRGELKHRSENGQAWSISPMWSQTLDTFVDHDASRSARELAKQIAAESPEPMDYPILLIGDAGAGKSHLLNAIKAYRTLRNPLSRGLLCTGADLVSHYWEYRAAGQSNALRFELRDRDCILIDDCAALFGDSAVEREFLDLINHCRSTSTQLLLAMTPEQHLTGPVSPELRSAFSKGTEVSLSAPRGDALRNLCAQRFGEIGVAKFGYEEGESAVSSGWNGVIEWMKRNS